ncbi:transcription factor-like protein DPB [Cocos nucifera]|uniref:Transcription factor-like protein DPB n=1 Tax=Cocos nucifera TaxID=13894 RepID=A0A8K0IFN2_COCNU|nr:transcription factor-like protein DPB [Cocos nucifera]
MVTGVGNRREEDGNKTVASLPKPPAGRGPSSWGTPAFSGGQSASTSGSAGSPSSRSEPTAATPASESTFVRLNHLDIHGDDAGSSQGAVSGKKKKRGARTVGGDKSGRGLRQFSMKDELVAEFADPNSNLATPDQQQYDEKNIRRRVYDALNVLMAMDIISKDKKEIQWKGLPRTSLNDIEELKAERIGLKSRIEKKSTYLHELQDQTRPHATVEVEISEDMQLVHFDFNSTPFELHDDSFVLKEMRFCERAQKDGAHEPSSNGGECSSTLSMYQHHVQQPVRPHSTPKLPTSPPIPGILKARVKHEH